MTTSDRARELEELLPCNEDRLCRPANMTMGGTPSPIHHGYKCVARLRPAILAYVQRKLDEANESIEELRRSIDVRRDEYAELGIQLDAARADSGLLAKVEQALVNHGHLALHVFEDGYSVTTAAVISKARLSPTLVEALHKLVGEES